MPVDIYDVNDLLAHKIRTLRTATVSISTEQRTQSDMINQDLQQQVVPLLRWLRTTRPLDNRDDSITFQLFPQTMVEHVVAEGKLTCDVHGTLLALPCLMSLDLRVDDALLHPIAQRHPRLRRLYLRNNDVAQSGIDVTLISLSRALKASVIWRSWISVAARISTMCTFVLAHCECSTHGEHQSTTKA